MAAGDQDTGIRPVRKHLLEDRQIGVRRVQA
jgi:hypothetical protein